MPKLWIARNNCESPVVRDFNTDYVLSPLPLVEVGDGLWNASLPHVIADKDYVGQDPQDCIMEMCPMFVHRHLSRELEPGEGPYKIDMPVIELPAKVVKT